MPKKRQATSRADTQRRKKARDMRQTRQTAASLAGSPAQNSPTADPDNQPIAPESPVTPPSPQASNPPDVKPEDDMKPDTVADEGATVPAPAPATAPAPPPDAPPPKTEDTAVVFQCANCRVVVGDTTTTYTADIANGTVSLAAATAVALNPTLVVAQTGHDAGCTFRAVRCAECDTHLGRVYSSTTPQLDACRSTYTLNTAALSSYELGSCTTVDGGAAPRSASGEALRALAEQRPAASTEADVHALQQQLCAMGDAMEKLRAEQADANDKVDGMAQTLTQNQESFDNVHRMFLIWEERFAAFQRCEARMNKLMTERRVRDRRLMPPQPSPPREAAAPAPGMQVMEPPRSAAMRGLPGIAPVASPSPARPLSAQRRRR